MDNPLAINRGRLLNSFHGQTISTPGFDSDANGSAEEASEIAVRGHFGEGGCLVVEGTLVGIASLMIAQQN